MKKWDKLNKELDDLLINMSDEDWDKWQLKRKQISKSEVKEWTHYCKCEIHRPMKQFPHICDNCNLTYN